MWACNIMYVTLYSIRYYIYSAQKLKLKFHISTMTFNIIRFLTILIILCTIISQISLAQDTEAIVDGFFSRGGHTNNWAVLVEYQHTLIKIYFVV